MTGRTDDMVSTALSLTDVHASYGDAAALRGVTLEVTSGQIVALIGRNGAGKTTTMRVIAGLNAATAGSVRLDGKDLGREKPYARVRRGIGYVQEGKRIFRGLTVEENLELGAYALPASKRAMSEALERNFVRFPMLAQKRRHLAGTLSGGQQQMLAIAQTLMGSPTVLLLDEPSVGLAPSIVAEVLEVARQLREEGLAIVLVEQAVELAQSIADAVVVLNLGRSIYSGPPYGDELKQAISAAYLGPRSTTPS